MNYRSEPWFALLQERCSAMSRKKVADALSISPPLLSQVLNGSGKYGSGEASTARLAERVIHTFGRYACPHLTEQAGEEKIITADQCHLYAHRPAPVGSPRDMQHWQSCQQCPHKAHTAPHAKREHKPRKGRAEGAEGATSNTDEASQ